MKLTKKQKNRWFLITIILAVITVAIPSIAIDVNVTSHPLYAIILCGVSFWILGFGIGVSAGADDKE